MKYSPQRLLLALLSCVCLTQAQAVELPKLLPVPEYTMKAVYLYNFAQLTEWPAKPEAAGATFNICTYGQDVLASALAALHGRTVNQQPLRFLQVTNAEEASQCQLLYIGEDEAERGSHLVEALRGAPVLTVTDAPLVARSGAMLLITTEAQRLAFEVNVNSAKRSQLTFSSKLLRLAKRISD
jgi:hypothetical protein